MKIETLPSVPAGSYIEASTLYAQCYAGTSTSKPFSLNKVTASWWNASTLGWNPQPSSTDIQANVNRNTSTNVIAFTNCRDTVARMYNGNMENNGFMIHYTDETQNDYNSIYSYENSNTSGIPIYGCNTEPRPISRTGPIISAIKTADSIWMCRIGEVHRPT